MKEKIKGIFTGTILATLWKMMCWTGMNQQLQALSRVVAFLMSQPMLGNDIKREGQNIANSRLQVFLKERYLNAERQQDKHNIRHHSLFARSRNSILWECHR